MTARFTDGHLSPSFYKTLSLRLLAGLIADRTAGLARGLAGGLALAATALLQRALKFLRVKCLDMLHGLSPFSQRFRILYHTFL